MRVVNQLPLEPPSKETIRAGIPNAARYQPEPRLIRQVAMTRDDKGRAVTLAPDGSRRTLSPVLEAVHEALDQGLTVADTIELAKTRAPAHLRRMVRRYVRSYLLLLAEDDIVELDFDPPPEVFAGRYRRIRELGRGGMGIVDLAHDEADGNRPVVVKRAWGWSKPVEKADRSNRREGAILQRLDHPLIPKLTDHFESGGIMHLVRPFEDGDLIGRVPDAAKRTAIIRDLADAMASIHESGFLYLDAKPGNFLYRTDGRTVILDFGLVKPHVDGWRTTGRSPGGTRGYASPEAIAKTAVGIPSDIFSLGRVWYYMVTRRRAKLAWSCAEFDALLHEAGAAEAEMALIRRMCAPAIADRPATMREVLDAL